MAISNEQIKLYVDGMEKLMAQIDQATADFITVQKSIGNAMDNLSDSLAGSSKTAFDNKSDTIKAVLLLQNGILVKVKEDALTAIDTLMETDKQIATGVNIDADWI
jgi:uncharacterized protein YukE